jgi:DNA repair protein RecO (recombination protein O)
MAIDQAEAIVLRSFNVGDQDKIVVFFSRDKGILRGVAKGARKFGNRFGSSLEPMSWVRILYYEKERKDLVTVSDCDLLMSFFDLQKNLETSFTLSYFAELVEEFIPARSKEDTLFRLLLTVLDSLNKSGDLNFLSRYFEAWFLKINGFLPDLRQCKRCRHRLADSGWLSPKKDGAYCEGCAPQKKEPLQPEVSLFLDWVRKNPPPEAGVALPFAPAQLDSIRKALQSIIIFHLEKEPRTLAFLKT